MGIGECVPVRYNVEMNAEIRSLLRCPTCLGPLEASTEPDGFRCVRCEANYPVVAGIPRFAGASYVASFGRQWNRYDVARDAEDEAVFAVKTGMNPLDLAGKLVLDAGCGGGRYSRLAARFGAKVVGVDLSSAVEKARNLCRDQPDVAVVQADLTRIPLVESAFDLAFSIGVLHHGPDPRAGFAEVAKRVKPGGLLAVWLYRKNTWPQEMVNKALRALTTRMPARVLEPLCAGLGGFGSVPVLNKSLNKVANFSNHPDWTLRICDNFDWYAPKYQSHHTTEELKRWFAEEGFGELRELSPLRSGRIYDWSYRHNMIIGSGVNVVGRRLS